MTEFKVGNSKIQLDYNNQPWGFFSVMVDGVKVGTAVNTRGGWVTHEQNVKISNIRETTQRKYVIAVARKLGLA